MVPPLWDLPANTNRAHVGLILAFFLDISLFEFVCLVKEPESFFRVLQSQLSFASLVFEKVGVS